jgi:hypothetical protein
VCLQASEVRVNFVVMRQPEPQEEGGSGGEGQGRVARRAPEPQYFRRPSTYMKVNNLLPQRLELTNHCTTNCCISQLVLCMLV